MLELKASKIGFMCDSFVLKSCLTRTTVRYMADFSAKIQS